MKYVAAIIGLVLLLLVVVVPATSAVPPSVPSSELRIASMEANRSAGNMTELDEQKLMDQIAAFLCDTRNAPDVKQLLNAHDDGRKYTVKVFNYTFRNEGYDVIVKLNAINKPIDRTNRTDEILIVSGDVQKSIPVCVDMMQALFADKRISQVYIQDYETVLDKFGHKIEVGALQVGMFNTTAAKIGNWNDFKQYVGTDLSKLKEVSDSWWVNDIIKSLAE